MPAPAPLSHKKEAAIAALLTEPTLESAASKAGISLSTLKRWRSEPAFRDALNEARRRVLEEVVTSLVSASTAATATLRAGLTAERPADRLRAAALILTHVTKAVEVFDLTEQVAELRRQIEASLNSSIRGVAG